MTYLLCWGHLIATCRCNDTFTISARPESIGRIFWRAIACGEPPLEFRGNRDKLNILKHDSELPNDGTPGEIAEKSPFEHFYPLETRSYRRESGDVANHGTKQPHQPLNHMGKGIVARIWPWSRLLKPFLVFSFSRSS